MGALFLVIVSIFGTLFITTYGKKIFSFIKITTVSREEAALEFLSREVVFKWEPQIIDRPIATNVVDFDEIKQKRKKKKNVEK